MKTEKLKLKTVNIGELKLFENNPRIHGEKLINKLVSSIKRYGYTSPIIVSKDNDVIAGHARIEALKRLNKSEVQVIEVPLEKEEIVSYNITDNRLQEESSWNSEMLNDLLTDLDDAGISGLELGFDESDLIKLSNIVDVTKETDFLNDYMETSQQRIKEENSKPEMGTVQDSNGDELPDNITGGVEELDDEEDDEQQRICFRFSESEIKIFNDGMNVVKQRFGINDNSKALINLLDWFMFEKWKE